MSHKLHPICILNIMALINLIKFVFKKKINKKILINELFTILDTLISERGEKMNVVRLVKKAKRGDKEALLQLIMSQKDTYYRLAYSYTGYKEDALDAMEDMIVILYEQVQQLQKEESFYSWSKTILVNCCKSLLLKRNKLLLIDDLNVIENNELSNANRVDPYRKSDQQIDLQSLLLHLNEYQREAIQLKYFHDFDNQTIAEITKVSIGTVKSRIFEGLKKLREKYRGDVHE